MKKGGNSGGGESSLGYLFGSDNKPKNEVAPPSPSACTPPYGIDTDDNEYYKPPGKSRPPPHEHKSTVSNNYPRVQGQNSGNFITGRPTTKVKCAPGGDSSLGYLFGDTS